MNRERLKRKIVRSLRSQGFVLGKYEIQPPKKLDKKKLRELHRPAVLHRLERSREYMAKQEHSLLSHFASGVDVVPEKINPLLVEVHGETEEEILFRYASLHWSIPISSGYGRRLRFLVVDEQNRKLIGIIGLGDPVFSLSARDNWLGWTTEGKKKRLRHIMDAFVLGAVPPYSSLLCGKLVAMLAASDEVRLAFKRKYGNQRSLIRGETFDGRLLLITTTSALGRSSVYNRLKYAGRFVFESVGFTKGYGEFHFSDGLYDDISRYASRHCDPTAKEKLWGKGFRNRREVIRKCLLKVGISGEWLYHGIQREIFAVPLAANAKEFLRGEHSRAYWHHQPAKALSSWFRERWLLPRSQRDPSYREFKPESYALWNSRGNCK